MAKELKLMKGNEAIAEGAIRSGVDGYFGYPITPQSEILEHFFREYHGMSIIGFFDLFLFLLQVHIVFYG